MMKQKNMSVRRVGKTDFFRPVNPERDGPLRGKLKDLLPPGFTPIRKRAKLRVR